MTEETRNAIREVLERLKKEASAIHTKKQGKAWLYFTDFDKEIDEREGVGVYLRAKSIYAMIEKELDQLTDHNEH